MDFSDYELGEFKANILEVNDGSLGG